MLSFALCRGRGVAGSEKLGMDGDGVVGRDCAERDMTWARLGGLIVVFVVCDSSDVWHANENVASSSSTNGDETISWSDSFSLSVFGDTDGEGG